MGSICMPFFCIYGTWVTFKMLWRWNGRHTRFLYSESWLITFQYTVSLCSCGRGSPRRQILYEEAGHFQVFFPSFLWRSVYHIFFLKSILLANDMVAPFQQWLAGTLSRRSKYWRENVWECRNRGVYKSYLCPSISNPFQRPLRFCSLLSLSSVSSFFLWKCIVVPCSDKGVLCEM